MGGGAGDMDGGGAGNMKGSWQHGRGTAKIGGGANMG